MRNIIIALGLITALSGCVTPNLSTQPIPASFLQPCADLELLEGIDGKAALTNIINNAEISGECRRKMQALIDVVKVRQR